MKTIIKLCLALSLAFTTLAFVDVPNGEAKAQSCEKELKALEKELIALEKQVPSSLWKAFKAEGWKGIKKYRAQNKEMKKLEKKVKNLTKSIENGLNCAFAPM